MPRFMVTRSLPPLTEQELQTVGRNVVRAGDQIGVQWIRSHVTSDGKHSFCELEAPNADACKKHSELAGLPFDAVIALGREIGPVT
jgi:hypothetical protein